jgi:hypothetical protein
MRHFAATTVALLIVACGGAPPQAAPSAAPSATQAAGPSATAAAATPAPSAVNGVTSTLFAVSKFSGIDASANAVSGAWDAKINTKGESDVYMLENRIAPGGSFGWHSHPGPSIVLVKTGTVAVGGDVHVVRNEGTVETVVYVMSIVPRGAARKTDQQQPTNCPGIK